MPWGQTLRAASARAWSLRARILGKGQVCKAVVSAVVWSKIEGWGPLMLLFLMCGQFHGGQSHWWSNLSWLKPCKCKAVDWAQERETEGQSSWSCKHRGQNDNCCRHMSSCNGLTLVLKIAVFWDVTSRSLVEIYQRFGGVYCLHHQCCENLKWH
jgi:hypothetical protein